MVVLPPSSCAHITALSSLLRLPLDVYLCFGVLGSGAAAEPASGHAHWAWKSAGLDFVCFAGFFCVLFVCAEELVNVL